MKKIIAFLLLAAMIFTLCACKKSENSPTEPEATTAPEETVPEQVWLLTEKTVFFPNGNPSTLITRGYNEKGDVVEYEVVEYEFTGEEYSRTRYTYNEKGDVTEYTYTEMGEVQVFEKYTYVYDGDKITEKARLDADGAQVWRRTYSYNADNKPLQVLYYDSENVLATTTDYSYDESGALTLTLEYTPLEMEISRYEYRYNDAGKLLWEAYYESGVPVFSDEFTYDEKGNAVEVIHFEAWDESTTRSVYEYDDRGRQVKHLRYNENEEQEYHSEDTYDEMGNLLVHTEFNDLGEETSAHYTIYDEDGNLAVEIYTYWEEETTRYTRKYDNGRLTKKLSYYKGELDITTTYTYDENGNCISATDVDNYGNTTGWTTCAFVPIEADGERAAALRAEQEALLIDR